MWCKLLIFSIGLISVPRVNVIFINKNEKWLTIGDGRYGSEAAWLKRNGVNCHSSDMHTNLLEDAYKKGLIDSFFISGIFKII